MKTKPRPKRAAKKWAMAETCITCRPARLMANISPVGVRKALDAGAEAVYLEEPEFWARSGWSEGFKREWKDYYHEDWVAPDSSPEAQYRASKLKYFLYRRALAQVFASVKQWGQEHGKSIPCYVPTHSLINYCALAYRQSGIIALAGGMRWLHRAGLDRHEPHA